MFVFRQVVDVALEDFGLKRPSRATDAAAEADKPVQPAPGPAPRTPAEAAPGVVWHGTARRRPELQRFCDHLEARRAEAAARSS